MKKELLKNEKTNTTERFNTIVNFAENYFNNANINESEKKDLYDQISEMFEGFKKTN